MRAVVVYESMYGNTRRIAERIGEGLATAEVTVLPAHEVTADGLAEADLIVLGAPTHVHGLPRPATRQGAVDQVSEDLVLEPEATAEGVRELLATVPAGNGRLAAAFDTRVDMSPVLSGRAAKHIAHDLRHLRYRLVAEPESFLVDRDTRLLPGELERALAWGTDLARAVAAVRAA
jgi:hypothetical protein